MSTTKKKGVAAPKIAPRKPVLQKSEPAAPAAEQTTPSPLRWGYIVTVIFGAALLAVCTVLAWGGRMHGFEHHAFVVVNGAWLPHWVTSQVAKPISDAVWGIMGLIVLFLFIPKYRLRAWQYAVAAGSAYVVAAVVERIVGRGRPVVLTHDLLLRASQGGAGFPSGHVSVLTALCVTLWVYVAWPWRIVMVGLVIAEAWSRVFLGVHAPLDVVGGVGVGLAVGAAIRILPARLRKMFWIT